MIEQGLFTLLSTAPAILSIVGTRVYPQKAPQNAGRGYIVYRRIMNEPRRNLRGSSRLKRATIQIDCYGGSYHEAKDLLSAVQGAITEDGQKNVTWGGKAVRVAYIEGDGDDYIPPQTNDDAGVHSVSLDLVVWYTP